jgi:zinc D-Ala-D-Ala carboxypeptidase
MKMPILKLRGGTKTKLSPHFSLEELTKSMTASRLMINNSDPGEFEVNNLTKLSTEILEPIRKEYGAFTPSSGYRCVALNRTLGSSDKSSHCKGEAADIEIVGLSNLTLAKWIKDNLPFDQVILEYYDGENPNSGWVHVSYSDGANRGLALTINQYGTFSGLAK